MWKLFEGDVSELYYCVYESYPQFKKGCVRLAFQGQFLDPKMKIDEYRMNPHVPINAEIPLYYFGSK